jgi:iron complex outermembrane receptor protein
VATAIDYLPGVVIDHISSGRNEAGIRVRGFTSRGQVPLYLDGIPVSVPYDGTVDFNRFLTSDIAEIRCQGIFLSFARSERLGRIHQPGHQTAGKEI